VIYQAKKSVVLAVLAATLTACGGGGDDAPPPQVSTERPEGVFGGKLTGSTSTDFQMLILDNGELWSIYGVDTPAGFGLAGFIQATIAASNASFTSSNARDYGVVPAVAGSATGTFNKAAGTIAGSVTAGAGTVSFTGGPVAGSLYNYNLAASVSTVVGNWTLDSLAGDTISLVVQPNGSLSATTTSGCNFTGAVTPRASGKNVFDATVTFGPSPCALANQSASGIAIASPIAGGQTQLLVALQDSSRSVGTAAFGSRWTS